MSEFTYEAETRETRLETFEWDNVWWEHADENSTPRVLYIGDSISCGIRRKATEIAENKIFFDGFGTSKSLDNPYFKESLLLFTKQQGKREAILFNNGLHGWHLNDEKEYRAYYEEMIVFLLKEFDGAPLVLVLTTHVLNKERDERVVARNRVVAELAEKYNLQTIDLYSPSKAHETLYTPGGVHFRNEGNCLLSEELVKNVRRIINS